MLRPAELGLSLLLFSLPALGQATPAESQTLQALLAEICQLHQDLQTPAMAARRAQILIYQLHLKAQMGVLLPEEQEVQMRETELAQQSRIEQAKLDGLEDEMDRLDQAVMNAALHTAPSAHQ